MATNDSPFRAALLRMSATVDELFELERTREASNAAATYRVDTLSKSLANPFAQQVEITLSNARIAIQDDGDRAVLVAAARAFHEKGQLSAEGLARLLGEYGVQ